MGVVERLWPVLAAAIGLAVVVAFARAAGHRDDGLDDDGGGDEWGEW